MASILTTGVVFATGILVGLGLTWRRNEALRMTVRTLEHERDTFRRDDIQTWLDDIGPVTPPDSPAAVPGLVLFDQDEPPDDPGPLTEPHFREP